MNVLTVRYAASGATMFNYGDMITFKNNTVRPYDQEFVDTDVLSIEVKEGWEAKGKVQVQLSGPLQVGTCEVLKLKATASGKNHHLYQNVYRPQSQASRRLLFQ